MKVCALHIYVIVIEKLINQKNIIVFRKMNCSCEINYANERNYSFIGKYVDELKFVVNRPTLVHRFFVFRIYVDKFFVSDGVD